MFCAVSVTANVVPREDLVPFSCKGQGFCPSCGGRRMTGRAAHLWWDQVLPPVPGRQWMLTVSYGSGIGWRSTTA
jgi:hypothetical protein